MQMDTFFSTLRVYAVTARNLQKERVICHAEIFVEDMSCRSNLSSMLLQAVYAHEPLIYGVRQRKGKHFEDLKTVATDTKGGRLQNYTVY